MLPDQYLITGKAESLEAFHEKLDQMLSTYTGIVQYRDKAASDSEFVLKAKLVVSKAHKCQKKVIINQRDHLLDQIRPDGIHFTTNQFMQMESLEFYNDYLCVGACHTLEHILHANKLRFDFIVLCPVFATPSSPKGIPLGWDKFSQLASKADMPVFALGGLNLEQKEIAQQYGAHGIAAIREFWEN